MIRDLRMSDGIRGSVRDELTININLAPTILAVTGLKRPEKMMGRGSSDIVSLYLNYLNNNRQTDHQSIALGQTKQIKPWQQDFF